MRTETITGPAHWASALVNGDYSGLSDEEAAWCRAWYADLGDGADVVGCAEEPRFSWHYDLHANGHCPVGVTGGDVIDYVVLYR